MINLLRSWLRMFAYRFPLPSALQRLVWAMADKSSSRSKDYWDAQLSGSFRDYLGGSANVDVRNLLVTTLLHHFVGNVSTLLDLGCGGGTLARALKTVAPVEYTGIDISEYAIRSVNRDTGSFVVSDLVDYTPESSTPFDAIVFNEVLYYLNPQRAVHEVARLCAFLSTRGVVVVSMKHDPKSLLIFKMLARDMSWCGSICYQAHFDGPRFTTRRDKKNPAFLVAALRPDRSDAAEPPDL